jgi:hypothetical protein
MTKPKLYQTYTLEELIAMELKELGGSEFKGYDIFYYKDLRINRERYLFHIEKGQNGDKPKYTLTCEYKI